MTRISIWAVQGLKTLLIFLWWSGRLRGQNVVAEVFDSN